MEGGSGQDMELTRAVAGKRRNEWAAAVAKNCDEQVSGQYRWRPFALTDPVM
jgi:hypothetical protein